LISATPDGSGLFKNTVTIDIHNGNALATYLTRVIFVWPTIPDYQNMFMAQMALDGAPHWKGMDKSDINSPTNTTDTNTDSSIPANYFQNTPQPDLTIDPGNTGNWTALLSNGPARLQDYVTIYNFTGTTFYLYNPLNPSTPCVVPLNLP